jgi:hypothetical protein
LLGPANQKRDRPYLMRPSVSVALFLKSLYMRYIAGNTRGSSNAALDSWPMERDYLHPGAKADSRYSLYFKII